MSAKTLRVSNLERRPVAFRGNTGESFHLAPLERDREIRALELEGNSQVEKLLRERVLAIAKAAPATTGKKKQQKKKAKAKGKSSKKKSDSRTAAESGSNRVESPQPAGS